MAKLPIISGNKIIRYLSNEKKFKVSRSKGSHVILKSEDNTRTVVVPLHETLDRGTLRSILLHAGIDIDEFIQEWND